MAADVSTLVRLMNGAGADESGKSTAPITRDLLGGCCTLETKELDLDLQVPCGWEKRLDLKSGKVYLQRCNSTNSSSSPSDSNSRAAAGKLQDLNFPPTAKQTAATLNLFENPNLLDLKLVASSSSPSSYQSVCTLDKVKSALERAEKETVIKKRNSMSISNKSSSSPRSNSSSSIKLDGGGDNLDHEERSPSWGGGGGSFAAGCPNCLLYVLISTNNPKCPRCNSNVPLPAAVAAAAKKPRIDLNISM